MMTKDHEKYREMLHKVANMKPEERTNFFNDTLHRKASELSVVDVMDIEGFLHNEKARGEQHA